MGLFWRWPFGLRDYAAAVADGGGADVEVCARCLTPLDHFEARFNRAFWGMAHARCPDGATPVWPPRFKPPLDPVAVMNQIWALLEHLGQMTMKRQTLPIAQARPTVARSTATPAQATPAYRTPARRTAPSTPALATRSSTRKPKALQREFGLRSGSRTSTASWRPPPTPKTPAPPAARASEDTRSSPPRLLGKRSPPAKEVAPGPDVEAMDVEAEAADDALPPSGQEARKKRKKRNKKKKTNTTVEPVEAAAAALASSEVVVADNITKPALNISMAKLDASAIAEEVKRRRQQRKEQQEIKDAVGARVDELERDGYLGEKECVVFNRELRVKSGLDLDVAESIERGSWEDMRMRSFAVEAVKFPEKHAETLKDLLERDNALRRHLPEKWRTWMASGIE